MSTIRNNKEISEDYDKSLLSFLEDLEASYKTCDATLLDLELSPDDDGFIKKLLTAVNEIEAGLQYIGMAELAPMIMALQKILDSLKNKDIPYDSVLGDLILLAMDLSREEVSSRLELNKTAYSLEQLDTITDAISAVSKSTKKNYRELLRQAVLAMDPNTALDYEFEQDAAFQIYSSEDVLYACGIVIDDDIRFFMRQAHAVDERSKYWQGRSDRVLQQTLLLNALCDKPTNADQLAVAVLTHETAMAYLPLELLHKQGELSVEEAALIQNHPIVSSQLLKGLGRWQEAAEIIEQHHEREDGSGYPNKLKSNEICTGAKMLAISDAFEACTHNRSYITRIKRPILRAILKLQQNSGSQFDKQYVSAFIQMIRKEQQASKERIH